MLKHLKKFALFLALGGVLTGFLAEQINTFQHPESILLSKSDGEKKDNPETKKLGEDEKFQAKELSLEFLGFRLGTAHRCALCFQLTIPRSTDCISILTPPPERT